MCLATQAPAEHLSLASSSCSRQSLQHQAPAGHHLSIYLPPVSEVSITKDSCRTQLTPASLLESTVSPTLGSHSTWQPAAPRSFLMHLFYQIQSSVTSRALSNFSALHLSPAMHLPRRAKTAPPWMIYFNPTGTGHSLYLLLFLPSLELSLTLFFF